MNQYFLITIFLVIIIVLFMLLLRNRYFPTTISNKYCKHHQRISQYSPEYRQSTKCFDCLSEPGKITRSQEHWNLSYGNAKLSNGM